MGAIDWNNYQMCRWRFQKLIIPWNRKTIALFFIAYDKAEPQVTIKNTKSSKPMGDRAFGIFGCSVDNGRRTTVEIKMTLADSIDFNPRLKFI